MILKRVYGFSFCLFLVISTLAQQMALVLPIGHTASVDLAQFTSDEKKIITKSYEDKSVKFWDANTGKLLLNLENISIYSQQPFTLSPDGKQFAAAMLDRSVKVWNINTGLLMVDLRLDTAKNQPLAFSNDGKKVAVVAYDSVINIWNINQRTCSITLKGHSEKIEIAEFSPDDKTIATVSWDGTIKIWNLISGKIITNLPFPDNDINRLVFSPDKQNLITVSDSVIKCWSIGKAKLSFQPVKFNGFIFSLRFSPDGKKMVLTPSGDSIYVLDAISGAELQVLKVIRGAFSAQFSPDGKKIAAACIDKTVKIWDAKTGILQKVLNGHSGIVNAIAFSQNGKKIISTSDDNTVKVWGLPMGELILDLKGHSSPVRFAQFCPDGQKAFIISNDKTIKLWDIFSGEIVFELKGNSATAKMAQITPDGKKVLINRYRNVEIWDVNTGLLVKKITNAHVAKVREIQLSPDGNKFVTASGDKTAKVWDMDTGELLADLKGHSAPLWSAQFSPDGHKVVTASFDSTAKIWEVSTEHLLLDLRGSIGWVSSAEFDPKGKRIVTSSYDSMARIWDGITGKLLFTLRGHKEKMINSAQFSPDGQLVVTCSNTESPPLKIWDAKTGKFLYDLTENDIFESVPLSIQFIPGKNELAVGYMGKMTKIWDLLTGKLVRRFPGHTDWVQHVEISPDGKTMITSSRDNTCKFWNVETGKIRYTLLLTDSSDYLTLLPSGYYKCSPAAAKLLHYVTDKLKVITFEQLDVKYNRPDKVLAAIGNTDTALIKSYRKAWEKRIKKLGIDTTAFRDGYSVIEADFINRDNIEYDQKNERLILYIKGNDSTYKLDRFNIWVNESPVYGQRGISIRKKKINSFDSTITINLSQGENRIETSITNVNGIESYRMPLLVNYTPANKQREKTYFIGIGIDQYNDSKYNLKYSTKDIRDLSKKLKEKYSDIIIDTLFNENVTISNVKALKQKLLQTSVNDKVIISYSGHGMLSKDFDYYLSTYSVNFDKPEENGLPYDELESLLDSIPARKKLMLIDACHSGEVDKDDLIALEATDKKLIKGLKPVAYKTGGHLGLKNSFELMQSLFVNVGKSTGATIISAAAGTEFALEGIDNLPNGVFTYSILEAMNKYPTMKISELKKIVGERVVQLTNGLQKPTSRNETIAVDWEVW